MEKLNTKQVIVMRKFPGLRTGKYAAQAAHASLKVFFDLIKIQESSDEISPAIYFPYKDYTFRVDNEAVISWIENSFTKICVYVNSEQELLDIYNQAKEAGILCALIEDEGRTEFGGVKTLTCCAIGPDLSEKIDLITGKLPLM